MPTNSPMMAGSGWCTTGHLQKREIMTDIGPVAVAARACATAAAKVASASAFRRRAHLQVSFHHKPTQSQEMNRST